MNKQFLKENNLYEAHKHFLRLCEWSYVPSTLEEEGEDEQEQEPQQDMDMGGEQDQPPMGDNQGGDMSQGMGDPMMGGDDQGNGDAMGQDGAMDGQDPNAMPPMGDEQGMGDPMMGGDDMPMGDEMEAEDEEVIDVESITNAQEKMNDKVNHVGKDLGQVDDKIRSLFQAIDKMEQMIQNNNSEIASFKQEFEKRNPTATEKLNLRSLDSYPFNVSVKDYWANKNINGGYEVYGDNKEKTTDEYKITNNDVDDFSEREIEKSFNIDDDMQQDLKKIFGF